MCPTLQVTRQLKCRGSARTCQSEFIHKSSTAVLLGVFKFLHLRWQSFKACFQPVQSLVLAYLGVGLGKRMGRYDKNDDPIIAGAGCKQSLEVFRKRKPS